MYRTCRLSSLLLAWVVLSAATVRADERPWRPTLTPEILRENLRTDWYGAYLHGKKIGYVKTALIRLGDGPNAVYRVTQVLHMKVVSLGETLDTTALQEQEFDATTPYRLRRARSREELKGKSSQEITLKRTDKGFHVTVTTEGDTTTKDVGPVDFTLADALACYVWLRGRPAAGATVLTQDYNVRELRLEPDRRVLLGKKTALAKGVKVTYYEVKATNLRDKVVSLERYDDKGNLLSGVLDDSLEMRLEPEEQARNFKAGADLFVLGMVKIDRPLGTPTALTGLVFEVTGKDASRLKSGPCQSVVRNPSGTYTCKLGKDFGTPQPATAAEMKDCLESSTTYPAAHSRIKALARKAVGDARTDREKVERLVYFVHRYLRPSYRNKGLIVLNLLETREGDCTAYAALLTTVARAAGVPCREVSGLLYTGDAEKAFGGHAWNEVVIDGHWVPVDASSGQTQIDPTHISFGSDVQGGLNLLRLYGNLSLRVIEIRRKQ
jgi:hypothetical protein